ncbi:hypothetical protein ACH4PU_35930 [Streptomyces sp. NPDC021100]|uniref:hypothetical protein n=1 Tax=Streptomyces sp. NPDC021100 TaxID=3365114 RepID=UPI0037B7D173
MTRHTSERTEARALQRAEGIGYHEALDRIRAGEPRAAAGTVVATFTRENAWSLLWMLTVPGHGPYEKLRLEQHSWGAEAERDLDRALDVRGWQAASPLPADGPLPHTFTVPVRPTPRGERWKQRCRATARLYAEAGRGYHDIQEPYGAAVAAAIERAGLPVTDFWADAGEPRSIVITLQPESPADGGEDDDGEPRELLIIWTDAGAWQYAWMRPDGSNEYPDQLPDYPGPLALPEDVAEAVRTFLRRDPALPLERPDWQPSADYAPDARPYEAEEDDPDPDFERSLAAYLTHPDWLAQQQARQLWAADTARTDAPQRPGRA